MKVIGVTNKLCHGLRLFMWEYDDVDEDIPLDDAKVLSEAFGIDIDVIQSSGRAYHLISYDILTLDKVEEIQNNTSKFGDYLTIKELPLYDNEGLYNTLRVGKKGKKSYPRFITRFTASKNRHLKSQCHFRVYQLFCDVPDFPPSGRWINLEVMWSVYNTGIGAKPKKVNNCKVSLYCE